LATLKRLEELNISGTKISQSGVERLRRALPRCSVLWQPAIVEEAIEEDPSKIEELDDLFSGPPGPNTNTSQMEGDELVKFFLDKDQRWGYRTQAATRLRKTGRTKELWTALDDETEHIEVRRRCLIEISVAANTVVVDKLIAYVENPEIGINAHEQLRKLTHAELQDHGRADGRRDLALSWYRWWRMNRDTATLDREAVRMDH
jgi:hypothetical protein